MTGVTFFETLRRHWRAMLYWGLGVGLMALLQVVIVPDADALRQMTAAYEAFPPEFLAAFGITDLEYAATAEGYLASQFFSIALVIFAVYAVIAGLNVTANDEDAGITNTLLSLPLARWQWMLEKTLAYAVMISVAVLLTFAGLWVGIVMTPSVEVDFGKILVTTLNIIPPALAILLFTVLMGAIFRRKSLVTTLAAVFVVASYFIDTLGRAASTTFAADLRALSIFRYYDGPGVMQYGPDAANIALLVTAVVLMLIVSLWTFQRRDLA
ncbi:MAG: ABC transporter permease subunit [bacterium]|nr:ABC transporter permease subunit [bacterium]